MEPARPDRNVGLAGTPHDTIRVAVLQPLAHLRRIVPGIRHERGIDRAPVGITRRPTLVSDPPDVGTRIREHQRTRLQPANRAVNTIPVVYLLLSVRPFSVRAVEEQLDDRPVLRQQLGQLRDVVVVVAPAVAVRAFVTVPRREVQPRSQPLGAHRIHELAHHVAVPVAPRTVLHRVFRVLARPQAEAVVMLRGEDHVLESAGLRGARPLPRVEANRIERAWILLAVAPLAIGEGVHPEMGEQTEFRALPPELRSRRHGKVRRDLRQLERPARRRADGRRTRRQKIPPSHSRLTRCPWPISPLPLTPLTRRASPTRHSPLPPTASKRPTPPPTRAARQTSRRSGSGRARALASRRIPTRARRTPSAPADTCARAS